MLTCIFLACKIEERSTDVNEIALVAGLQKPQDILANELALVSGLRFHFIVFHPYHPLQSLISDLKANLRLEAGKEFPTTLESDANQLAERSLTTDLCLTYSPAQIALGVLSKITEKHPHLPFREYVETTYGSNPVFSEVKQAIEKIKAALDSLTEVAKERVTAIDKKLRMNPHSEIFKQTRARKKKEKDEQIELRKRQKMAKAEAQAKTEQQQITGTAPGIPPTNSESVNKVLNY
eukprot:TRINITY_DN1292_c0_g1_i1.p1 TRINITY_DN1292_c0_g1~~TRINITY_DN1292_c0_g1_i1.p1  ORF type:complete len:236 (-),score=57.77 TRINITY_DN1292_c0_g1_i1:41-748(-)